MYRRAKGGDIGCLRHFELKMSGWYRGFSGANACHGRLSHPMRLKAFCGQKSCTYAGVLELKRAPWASIPPHSSSRRVGRF